MPRVADLPAADYVSLDGVEVATYVLEPPDGARADVVLCHGTPWSARVWAEVAHHLSRHHRVFLWDMPGYGNSVMSPDVRVDLLTQMERLAALLRVWGLDRPHVVAHDVGGAVTLGAHLLHHCDYTRLYLWDVVTLAPWGSPFFRLVADNPTVFPELPARLHAALVREYIAGAGRHGLPAETVEMLAGPWLSPAGQAAFYRQIAALRPAHTVAVAQRLSDVRCPVGIGWGTEDPWIPVNQAFELQELLPGTSPVVELAGVGHLAPLEDAPGVSHALDVWLE